MSTPVLVALLVSAGTLCATTSTAWAGVRPAPPTRTTFEAASGQSQFPCGVLCVMAATGTSVSVSGNSSLFAAYQGGMMVDSTGAPAIEVSGDGGIGGGPLGTTSPPQASVSMSGQGAVFSASQSEVMPVVDPLRGLSGVAVPTLRARAQAVSVTEQTSTIRPGVYSTIEVSGTGRLVLEPGTYVITHGLTIGGSGSVSGTAVTLYFGCPSYPTPCRAGQMGATFDVSGNGLLDVSPPPDNSSCLGLSVVFDPDNRASIEVPGTGDPGDYGISVLLHGILYAPAAHVEVSGAGAGMLVGEAVVGSVGLTNSGELQALGDALDPDVCSLAFAADGEPTSQVPDTPIAGGPANDYLPAGTNPILVDAVGDNGSIMTSFDGPVTVSIAAGTGTAGASLNARGGSVTVDAVKGVASFSGLSVDMSGSAYQLQASAVGFNPPPASSAFDIYSAVAECAPNGGACSASSADLEASAAISYVDETSDPEYVLISVSQSFQYGPCPFSFNGPSGVVSAGIYDEVTGAEDVTSPATIDATINAPFVQQPPPTNEWTGQAAYAVCYAAAISTPFQADPDYGSIGEDVDGELLELGVLGQCGATVPASNPAPPEFLPPPFFPFSPTFTDTTYEPPCTNFDNLNPDGSVSAEWVMVGDPAARDG